MSGVRGSDMKAGQVIGASVGVAFGLFSSLLLAGQCAFGLLAAPGYKLAAWLGLGLWGGTVVIAVVNAMLYGFVGFEFGAVLQKPRPRAWSDRRFPTGECQRCGYDLTGNVSGVCPECGTPIERVAPDDGSQPSFRQDDEA